MKRFLFACALLATVLTASAQYQGDIRLGDTIDFKFTTVDTSGVPTNLSSGTVVCYPGNSATEITAGITLSGSPFDTSVAGLNNVRIVASGGNGYATATNYQCVLSVGTVGGASVVGYVVGSFSIEGRSALMPTTATRTLDVTATGEGGVDWANVGSPTTTLALTGTTIASTQKVDVETIKTNPVVNGGTITFPSGATLASTTNITAGTITTATTATNVTTVNGLAANVITAASMASDAGAEIATAIWTDTTAGDFTTALSVGKSVMNGVSLGTGLKVDQLTTNLDKTDYELTTAYADTAELADAVWDEATAGHSTAGTTGKALTDAGSAGDPWSTAVPGAYTAGTAGYLIGTYLDAAVSSRMATYTQPTGFLAATFPGGTIANTTNITAGTIATVTTLTNLPSIPANWITSAGITAAALNGKGDWNIGKTGYTLSQAFPTNFSSLSIDGSGRVDVIKLAGQTVTAAAGVTFPTSVASPTNITAGTITTATNVTTVNGLAAGVITATSIAANAITDAKVDPDVTIASVTGAVGSVTGSVAGNVNGNVDGSVSGTVGSVVGNVDGTINGLTATALKNFFEVASGLDYSSAVSQSVVKEIADNAGGGGGGLDAAGVRAAIGMASANLDTQLDALPTNAELATALGTADDATLTQIALIKAVTDKLETMIEDADVPGYRYTISALENGPAGGGGGVTAEEIATAVWVESIESKPASEWLHRAGAKP